MNTRHRLACSGSTRVKARRHPGPLVETLEDRRLLSSAAATTASWVPIGPAPILSGLTPGSMPVTGRIAAIAASPTDPNTIYVGAAAGGVWKTVDGGTSWTPLTDNQATLSTGAIAIAPTNPNI